MTHVDRCPRPAVTSVMVASAALALLLPGAVAGGQVPNPGWRCPNGKSWSECGHSACGEKYLCTDDIGGDLALESDPGSGLDVISQGGPHTPGPESESGDEAMCSDDDLSFLDIVQPAEPQTAPESVAPWADPANEMSPTASPRVFPEVYSGTATGLLDLNGEFESCREPSANLDPAASIRGVPGEEWALEFEPPGAGVDAQAANSATGTRSVDAVLAGFTERAMTDHIGWADTGDGKSGIPLDMNRDGMFGRDDAMLYRNDDGSAEVLMDTDRDGFADHRLRVNSDGEKFSEPLRGGRRSMHAEPMPPLPGEIDQKAYHDAYCAYKQAAASAASRPFKESEITDVLLDYTVVQPVKELLTAEAIGAVLGVQKKLVDLVTSTPSDALELTSILDGIGGVGSTFKAVLPSLNVLAGNLDVNKIADYYESQYNVWGNTWVFDGIDVGYISTKSLTPAQVTGAARSRARRFVEHFRAMQAYAQAFAELEVLYSRP